MKDQIKIVDEEDVASIVYTVKNTGECVVDIDLEDFETENVEFFAHLFYNITSGKFSDTTIQLIQDGFSESGQPELYKVFLTRMQEIARVELSTHLKESRINEERNNNEGPCISPIDILLGG